MYALRQSRDIGGVVRILVPTPGPKGDEGVLHGSGHAVRKGGTWWMLHRGPSVTLVSVGAADGKSIGAWF